MKKKIISIITLLFIINITTGFATASAANLNTETGIDSSMSTESVDSTGFSVKDIGATGDGIHDDTVAIQSALDQYSNVYIPEGIYMIDADTSLKPHSDQTILLDSNAILKAKTSVTEKSTVILISNVSNITIIGGEILGERDTHNAGSGPYGMGISIKYGASNISIENIKISNCWGDGIYLGGSSNTEPVHDITLDHVICDNNRRQGMSITNADQVTIINCEFSNTQGTDPQCGVDIEPNVGNSVSNVMFQNTEFFQNAMNGLIIDGGKGSVQDITIMNCTSRDNGSAGIGIEQIDGLTLDHVTTENNDIGVNIMHDVSNAKFINLETFNNKAQGVKLIGKNQTTGIQNISFEDSKFYNNSDGICIDNYDKTGYVKDITFKSCSFSGSLIEKTQRYGAMVGSSKTVGKLVGIEMENCTFEGNYKDNVLINSKATVDIIK